MLVYLTLIFSKYLNDVCDTRSRLSVFISSWLRIVQYRFRICRGQIVHPAIYIPTVRKVAFRCQDPIIYVILLLQLLLQLKRRFNPNFIEFVFFKGTEYSNIGSSEESIANSVSKLSIRFNLWCVKLAYIDALPADKV